MQCSRTRRKVLPRPSAGLPEPTPEVTVRQNGYVLYQTYVTPGAFVIDDLYPTASSGNLEVAVKESDGEIRRFTQPYASVTSMQREGSLKYNPSPGATIATMPASGR